MPYNVGDFDTGAVASGGPNVFGDPRQIVCAYWGLNGWTVAVDATLTPGAGDSLDIDIEHSLTGTGNWIGALSIPTVSATGVQPVVIAGPLMPFVRMLTTQAGSGSWVINRLAIVGGSVRVVAV